MGQFTKCRTQNRERMDRFILTLVVFLSVLNASQGHAIVNRQAQSACNGIPSTDWECCSSSSPCNLGGGDCDFDSDCAGSLTCGSDNCLNDFPSGSWSYQADCCEGTTQPQPGSCNGIPFTDWNCCSNSSPCNLGGGDCDFDSECAGSLTCGSNNCQNDFPSGTWSYQADCCEAAPTTAAPTTAAPTTAAPTTPSFTCGIKPLGIVGGSEATPFSLPWQVALVHYSTNSRTFFCGGTLISDRHVLTAAHCTARFNGNWDVVVGEHSLSGTSDGTRHTKCRHENHPQYDIPTKENNDFAIVHLDKPVDLGTRAVPACLPTSSMGEEFLAGKILTVSGWGRIPSTGIPDKLRVVDVPAVTNAYCKEHWFSLFQKFITNKTLCAGRTDTPVGACRGDSGGPLTYNNAGRATLVGVVSWGDPNQDCPGPTVFARVTEELDWIKDEMTKHC